MHWITDYPQSKASQVSQVKKLENLLIHQRASIAEMEQKNLQKIRQIDQRPKKK